MGTQEVSVDYKTLPFGVEYAKSSRSSCKGCKDTIGQDSLRMSVREPSRFFDGLQDNWFHFSCFWKKIKSKKVEINERSIRGMEMLKWDDQEKIREKIQAHMSSDESAEGSTTSEFSFAKLRVESAKTSKSKCAACQLPILQKVLKFGRSTKWYHQKCLFIKGVLCEQSLLTSLNIFAIKQEPDEDSKENTNQVIKRHVLRDVSKCEELPPKKLRTDTDEDCDKKQLKEQADLMWTLRKAFKENLHKNEMVELLTANSQAVPSGESRIIDLLVDCVVFGCCLPCPKCKGQLVYSSTLRTYKCDGHLSEYTKCIYQSGNPERKKFVIPKEMKEENKYLKKLKINVFPKRVYNEALSNEIVVGHSDTFKHLGSRSLNWYDKGDMGAKSMGVGSGLSRQLIKGGTVVDQEFEFAKTCHVYRSNSGTIYSVVLGSVDMQTNRNSYYKLQLLKHDVKAIYYLFRSWGRVGTGIGGTKTEKFRDVSKAIEAFECLFSDKTGNSWEDKQNFKKLPGRMDIVETDFTDTEHVQDTKIVPGSKTKLHSAIKDIILMIFDLKQMEGAMLGFQLDLDKMPLGKLSKKQITNAYSVLTELQTILSETQDAAKILDASNRFYTLIPHNFGMEKPPLLRSSQMIKEKCDMLDSLLDMQIAYEVIRDQLDGAEDVDRDPVDIHYEKLKCEMEVVDPDSSEFETIKHYMANTRGATHTMFDLSIVDLIRVNRAGEKEKFKAEIGNRRLLWHGSSTTNYGGILSQGLRIAPPEAPVTGYMFGKGVYFADMVTKSANYCKIVSDNTDGLILLCDVALGNVKEELHAIDHSRRSLKGFNSVQGLGKTEPNPINTIESEEGYSIPLGKPVKAEKGESSSLLYNEYIVYDVDQIMIRYLVRTKFTMNM
ncbi:Protein phosphatase methylesterase 1 [Parelaphostrongylus tenuis]|uniref:Poly [ADP-ribose] polymerase n=1 Tax=Parelaphostrongylus tenuis TaxID=148309 RepID=A0AAD5RDQ9_PARTN|nr:Protein phosphatase methylesterase 1 [Parelaphostrongylus tenuis]